MKCVPTRTIAILKRVDKTHHDDQVGVQRHDGGGLHHRRRRGAGAGAACVGALRARFQGFRVGFKGF